ncbi:MAG: Dabb family protein [Ruminococcus sp.]|nr:Dabb family protein [Ruminococcus sp.]
MIRHIVMFKLKPEYEGRTAMENAREAKERAEKLIDLVPTLDKLEVCINTEKANPDNYEFALVCDFADIDALNAYQVHPEHVAFGQFINPRRDLRACIDYEV